MFLFVFGKEVAVFNRFNSCRFVPGSETPLPKNEPFFLFDISISLLPLL